MKLHIAHSTRSDRIKSRANLQNETLLQRFAKKHWGAIPRRIGSLDQVHGTRIVSLRAADTFVLGHGDGLFTDQSNTMLVIKSADCVPVVVFDPVRGILGMAHAGWRGTRSHIVKKLLDLMVRYGASEKAITITLGPSIHRCCYSVSRQRARAFREAFDSSVISEIDSQQYLDLSAAITIEAIRFGIPKRSIRRSLVCTSCSKPNRFYSYRQGDRNIFITAALFSP